MKKLKKIIIVVCLFVVIIPAQQATAQIKIEDLKDLDLGAILGKTKILSVKKGFNPIFKLGNYQVNTAGILGEHLKGINILGDILETKGIDKILGYYKTYKTGLVVFKILGAAGTVITIVSAVKGFTDQQKFDDPTVKGLLYPALGSIATGVITKLLTKAASYKAVDIFNGVVRNKIKDILSVKPASSTLGIGLYVKL